MNNRNKGLHLLFMLVWCGLLQTASHADLLRNVRFEGRSGRDPGPPWYFSSWGDTGGYLTQDPEEAHCNRIVITRHALGRDGITQKIQNFKPGFYTLRLTYKSEIPFLVEFRTRENGKLQDDLLKRGGHVPASDTWRTFHLIVETKQFVPNCWVMIYGQIPGSMWIREATLQAVTRDDFGPVTLRIDAAEPLEEISPDLFGMQAYASHYVLDAEGRRAPVWSDRMKQLCKASGMTHVRLYLYALFRSADGQDYIAPTEKGPRDYTLADAFLVMLEKEMGLEIIPCLALYCPAWLSTQRRQGPGHGRWISVQRSPPRDNKVWADIMMGLLRHWIRDLGLHIRLVQIGNEPNNVRKMWVGGTVEEFGEYFRVLAAKIHQEFPDMVISGPCMGGGPYHAPAWMRTFLRFGQDGLLTNVSWNRYNWLDIEENARYVRRELTRAGYDGNVSLWLSEYNYRTSGAGGMLDTESAGIHVARVLKRVAQTEIRRATLFGFGGARDSMGNVTHPNQSIDMVYKGRPRPGYLVFQALAVTFGFKGARRLFVEGEDPLRVEAWACRSSAGVSIALIGLNQMARGRVRIELFPMRGYASVYRFVFREDKAGFFEEMRNVPVEGGFDVRLDGGEQLKMIRITAQAMDSPAAAAMPIAEAHAE